MMADNIPRVILDRTQIIASNIQHFTTTLIVIEKRNIEHYYQIGSGTLIKYKSAHAILTARHVADQLDCNYFLGLNIIEKEHRFILPYNNKTNIRNLDTALIHIPTVNVGTIKASMSFYNLKNSNFIDKAKNKLTNGGWCICGCPGERSYEGIPETMDVEHLLTFQTFCGFSGDTEELIHEGDKYLETQVQYGTSFNGPIHYKGMSGGGIWQIIPSSDNMTIQYILKGVIVSESDLVNDRRKIRCVSIESFYTDVIDALYKYVI